MIITGLRITNLRAIETAEFRFKPGVNLIVGVNGVGKSTVLDAIAASLSAVVKKISKFGMRIESFKTADIRAGADALTVECNIRLNNSEFTYLIHKPRETAAPKKLGEGMPREQMYDTPVRGEFVGNPPVPKSEEEPNGRPLAILFSTNRAVPVERAPSKSAAAGGVAAAYAEAFAHRELRLGEFADWMRVQKSLRKDLPVASRALAAVEHAVRRFLPEYTNLRVEGDEVKQLWVNRGETAIPVRMLSDGERGTLALVLDLTKRLAQANPHLDDPAAHAEAVVLIDEIELHLHPKWQRQIVHNLISTFPCCQFIITTHSPQVIGEVEHDRIQIIADGMVYSPTHSYGVDSSRVLEEVMDSMSRSPDAQALISEASKAIGAQRFDEARHFVDELEKLTENPNDVEVTRLRTLLVFMEGD